MIAAADEITLPIPEGVRRPWRHGARPAVAAVGGASERGRRRRRNEDAWGRRGDEVVVVADGMGGRRAGAVAARAAVDALLAGLAAPGADHLAVVGAASRAVRDATTAERADEAAGPTPGGAAVVALRCVGGRVTIVHVGDARAYRLRGGAVEPLTRDHVVAEVIADLGVRRSRSGLRAHELAALTSFLGEEGSWHDVGVRSLTVEHGDRIVLCTDGCHRSLDAHVWRRAAHVASAQRAAGFLVERSVTAGAADDATAVVVDLELRGAGDPAGGVGP